MTLLRLAALLSAAPLISAAPQDAQMLRQNWWIQSSADVREPGSTLSTSDFNASGWYPATMPSTVLSALVQDHVYPDAYSGMNLRGIPGTSYPISTNFSNALMPPDSPFRRSWWYRTAFQIPESYKSRTVWLGFDGVNFRANVWMNGKQIASAAQMAGAWRLFEYDVTAAAQARRVECARHRSVSATAWRSFASRSSIGTRCRLTRTWGCGAMSTSAPPDRRPSAIPPCSRSLNSPANDQAALTVRGEVANAAARAVEGVLRGRIEGVEFSRPVKLAPHESRVVHFTPEQFAQLKIAKPRLWWPAQVGEQNLYPLRADFRNRRQAERLYASSSESGR